VVRDVPARPSRTISTSPIIRNDINNTNGPGGLGYQVQRYAGAAWPYQVYMQLMNEDYSLV